MGEFPEPSMAELCVPDSVNGSGVADGDSSSDGDLLNAIHDIVEDASSEVEEAHERTPSESALASALNDQHTPVDLGGELATPWLRHPTQEGALKEEDPMCCMQAGELE